MYNFLYYNSFIQNRTSCLSNLYTTIIEQTGIFLLHYRVSIYQYIANVPENHKDSRMEMLLARQTILKIQFTYFSIKNIDIIFNN